MARASGLAAAVAHLHAALARHPDLSDDDRALVQTAVADLQAALQASGAHGAVTTAPDASTPGTAPHDAVRRLEDVALSFEQRHPTLTALFTEVVEIARAAGV
jgi:hypothetical protein